MTSSANSEFVDYYALLDIKPSADLPQIRRSFILKAKQYHPDVGGSPQMMLQLNTAYKTLIGQSSKAAYDMLHGFHTGTTQPGDYSYHDGREVHDVNDMTDDEIDSFLDDLFAEYRNASPKPKPSVKQRIKKIFEI